MKKKRRLTLIRKPQSEIPDCPDWLSAEARKIWHERAPRLAELGLLTNLDRAAFAALCITCADYRKACQREKETGGKEAAIWKRIKKKSAKLVRKFAAEFFQAEEFEEWLKQQ